MTRQLIQAADSGSGLYDGVVEFAAGTPSWFQSLGELYTKAGLLIFGVLLLTAWWRGRATNDARAVALPLLASVVMVGAYALSELLKLVTHEDRPCRGLPREATISECPELGDWSFPSNHSTIAGAAAVGLTIAWRRVLPWVVGLAALMACSRVFVGAHYPHDVLAGLLFGAAVAWIAIRILEKHAISLVRKFGARRDVIGRLLFAQVPAGEAPTRWMQPQPRPEQPTVRVDRQPHRPVNQGQFDGPTVRKPRQGNGR